MPNTKNWKCCDLRLENICIVEQGIRDPTGTEGRGTNKSCVLAVFPKKNELSKKAQRNISQKICSPKKYTINFRFLDLRQNWWWREAKQRMKDKVSSCLLSDTATCRSFKWFHNFLLLCRCLALAIQNIFVENDSSPLLQRPANVIM